MSPKRRRVRKKKKQQQPHFTPPSPHPFIRKARRKDRFDMKLCNERNLKENYSLETWEQFLLHYPGQSYVVMNPQLNPQQVIGYLLSDGTTILSLAVDTEYRRQGWGNQLLSTFLKEENGRHSPLFLHVRVSNLPALTLYTKHGFKIQKTVSDYYSNPQENAYYMVRQ
jgi:ribosomal-protein-alanine N-acetyltransferase